MNPGHRQLLGLSLKVVDLLVMAVAFDLAAGALVLGSDWYSLEGLVDVRLKAWNLVLFLLLLALWNGTFSAFGLYRPRRLVSPFKEIVAIVKAASIGSTAAVGVASLIDIELAAPRFLMLFWVLSTSMTTLTRMCLRFVLERIRERGRNLRNMVIVGTNARALRFAELVESKPTLGYQVKGFIDDDWRGLGSFQATGREVVATLEDFGGYLRSHVVDEVVLALPVSSYYAHFLSILRACEEQGVLVHMLPDFFDVKHGRLSLEVLEDQPVITLRTGAMEGWPLMVKRAFDLVVALVLLILLTPLFIVVALLIKLTSPGPILFVQQRVGLHKRPFPFLTFRTMVRDAEARQKEFERLNEVSGPVFKIVNDPRTTPVGALLRKTSIDELPQLVNVLWGHMSLVGPRPLPIRDYQAFDADWHRRRFSVRPGLTCLWQVSGRNSIPFERWMELDMQYIDQWSLWLDFKILLMTLPAVVGGRGAS